LEIIEADRSVGLRPQPDVARLSEGLVLCIIMVPVVVMVGAYDDSGRVSNGGKRFVVKRLGVNLTSDATFATRNLFSA